MSANARWTLRNIRKTQRRKTFLTFLIVLSIVCAFLGSNDARAQRSARHNSSTPVTQATRIQSVENGLGPPVSIKGQSTGKSNLRDRMRFYKVPAVSIAVINNWSIDWAQAYGVKEAGRDEKITTDTLFQAASISKVTTAMAALRMIQEGALSLDEDVNKKLVSWKVPETALTETQKVTVRRLLSHSAGITNSSVGTYLPDQSLPTIYEILAGNPKSNSKPVQVAFVPGSRWQYSGGGYTILQQLLIDVSHESFSKLLNRTVFVPLKMKHSFFQQPLSRELAQSAARGHDENEQVFSGGYRVFPEMAAAGLWTTPSDLALFAIEIQRSWKGESNKILSRENTQQMLTRQAGHWGLGVDLGIEGQATSFNHSGWNDGYRSFMVAFPETGQGAVVMTNGDGTGPQLVFEIIRSIANEYEWPLYRTREHSVVQVDEKDRSAYLGEYQFSPGMKFIVTKNTGHLFLTAPPLGNEPVELFPETNERFFVIVNDVTFTFVKDSSGSVTEMIVQPPDQTVHARKIK
jgi:CubicO group peptidase (beta-lactamase class C family)